MRIYRALNGLLHEALLYCRDRFTGWWLLEMCNTPKAAMAWAEEAMEQIAARSHKAKERNTRGSLLPVRKRKNH